MITVTVSDILGDESKFTHSVLVLPRLFNVTCKVSLVIRIENLPRTEFTAQLADEVVLISSCEIMTGFPPIMI